MKSLWMVLIALAPVALLSAGLMSSAGWRPSAPQLDSGTQATNDQASALSCRAAFLAAPGVKAGMSCVQLQDVSQKLFGATSSRTLVQACRDARLVTTDEALFFPSRALCSNQSPSACLSTCEKYR